MLSPHPSVEAPAVIPPGNRVVVLASGTGSTLAALLAAHQDPAWGGRVVGVVSDRTGVRALDLAREAGVPTAVVALGDFPDRAAWDRAVVQTIGAFDPAWVVLAGFMKLLGAPVLERWGGRIVNTHPALSPAFPGAHGVRDALAHGVRVTGCTVHLVDAGIDTGPIIAQRAVDVRDDDDQESLHERIKGVERALLAEVVGRAVREGLEVSGRRVRFGGTPAP